VERFNVIRDDFKVELLYSESPSQSVLDGAQADVVIGEWLASPKIIDRFESTADIVKPGRIDPNRFYSGLISMGSKDNRPVLIPLSFDLPAVVFMSAPSMDIPPMFMPLELMRSMSGRFNVKGRSGYTAMGFSPLWNRDFFMEVSMLFGVRFRAGRDGMPIWDSEGLTRTVDFLRGWLTEINGGRDADAEFSEKNLVQPFYKLLEAKKTLFALKPFTELYALSEETRKELDFRWLSLSGQIPARDDVLFGGVLRKGRNTRGGKAFLEWLVDPQTQKDLLEVAQSRRISVFGVTNGFSALKAVNEKDLAQKYTNLLGHIPTEGLIQFPATLPDSWVKVRDEAINPWLAQAATGDVGPDLTQTLQQWRDAQSGK
jgi:hypothetical protein